MDPGSHCTVWQRVRESLGDGEIRPEMRRNASRPAHHRPHDTVAARLDRAIAQHLRRSLSDLTRPQTPAPRSAPRVSTAPSVNCYEGVNRVVASSRFAVSAS